MPQSHGWALGEKIRGKTAVVGVIGLGYGGLPLALLFEDAIVISTAHREFRDLTLYEKARLVVDTRNVVPPSALPPGTLVRA